MHLGSPGPSALSHMAGCGNLLGTNRLETRWMYRRPLSIVWENINSKLSRYPHPATTQHCHPGHQLTRARLCPLLSWRLCSPVRWQQASAHTGPATESCSLLSRTPRWERAVPRSTAGWARKTAACTRTLAPMPHHTQHRLALPGPELRPWLRAACQPSPGSAAFTRQTRACVHPGEVTPAFP